MATELSKGNYDARSYSGYARRSDRLGRAMNSLAVDLMEMTRTQDMRRDRLLTVIENIGSGLILIDGRGFINLVNRSYTKQFHTKPERLLRRLYHDAFEHEEIIRLVEDIFMTETKNASRSDFPSTLSGATLKLTAFRSWALTMNGRASSSSFTI